MKNYVILNRYPYTSGHVLIVPYAHTADFGQLDPETSAEIMQLAQRMQSALDAVYHPEGYNLGMNLGRSAGAGIADHLHMHLLPRWTGDTNFMTSIAKRVSNRKSFVSRTTSFARHLAYDFPVAIGLRSDSLNLELNEEQKLLSAPVRNLPKNEVKPLAAGDRRDRAFSPRNFS